MTTPVTWLMILSFVHAACSGTPSPTPTPSYSTAPPAAGPSKLADRALVTSSVPAISTTSTPLAPSVEYAPRGRRDPFTPVRVAEEAAPRRSILTSARLTGIVRSSHGAWALVETAEGTGFILRAGESFGEGRLLDIGEDFALFDVEPSSASMPTRVVLRLERTS